METKTEEGPTVGRVSIFWFVLIVGMAWASGYWAGKSVIFSPNGFMSQAQVQLGGLLVSVILLVIALALNQKLVKRP